MTHATKIGMSECEVAIVQIAKYLADSPKDNSDYIADAKAREDVKNMENYRWLCIYEMRQRL